MNNCLYCLAETKNSKYCNNTCQGLYNSTTLYEKYEANQDQYKKLPGYVRNKLLKDCNYKCPSCGWGEINHHTGNVPLEIDHIDGNPENNLLTNLRVLCPNCHSLTSTYKGANSNHGKRAWRKKYNQTKKELQNNSKEIKINELKNKILSSNIDFTKFGWVGKVSNILNITPQKTGKWMIKNMPEIYQNAFKRKGP